MQTISKYSLVFLGLSLLSISVSANTNNTSTSARDFDYNSDDASNYDDNSEASYDTGYIGIKGGLLMVDDSAAKSIDNPVNYGAYLGYKFNKNFGVEIDYTISKDANVTNANGDSGIYDVANYGTYLTYQYPINNTSIYAKARLGVGGAEIDEEYGSNQQSFDDIGVAGGLGLGMNVYRNIAIEADFNMLRTDNININTLTLGTHFSF